MKPAPRLGFVEQLLESPLEDDQVDRPDVSVQQCIQLTGTNGRTLGHIYLTLLINASKDNKKMAVAWISSKFPAPLLHFKPKVNQVRRA